MNTRAYIKARDSVIKEYKKVLDDNKDYALIQIKHLDNEIPVPVDIQTSKSVLVAILEQTAFVNRGDYFKGKKEKSEKFIKVFRRACDMILTPLKDNPNDMNVLINTINTYVEEEFILSNNLNDISKTISDCFERRQLLINLGHILPEYEYKKYSPETHPDIWPVGAKDKITISVAIKKTGRLLKEIARDIIDSPMCSICLILFLLGIGSIIFGCPLFLNNDNVFYAGLGSVVLGAFLFPAALDEI